MCLGSLPGLGTEKVIVNGVHKFLEIKVQKAIVIV